MFKFDLLFFDDLLLLLFSCSVTSDSFGPVECSTPGFPVHHHLPKLAHSCPLSCWCHPTILSSVIPFSSCLQSFPSSGSFPMSRLFISGGQSIGVSASASVSPKNIQDWWQYRPLSPYSNRNLDLPSAVPFRGGSFLPIIFCWPT